jgi:hypothetical protein
MFRQKLALIAKIIDYNIGSAFTHTWKKIAENCYHRLSGQKRVPERDGR